MLLGGLKFDLRLYMLLLNVGTGGGAQAFLCREGLVRRRLAALSSPGLRGIEATQDCVGSATDSNSASTPPTAPTPTRPHTHTHTRAPPCCGCR